MEVIAAVRMSLAIVWDISSGEIIETLNDHISEITRVCFSPCGTLLVSGSNDGSIILWDCQTWTKLQTLNGHTKSITSVSFNSGSEKILSTSRDFTIRVWSVTSGVEELTIETTTRLPYSTSFSSCGNTIAVACHEIVRLYHACTGELQQNLCINSAFITIVQFSQDGCLLASASADSRFIIWDVASGCVLRDLRGHMLGITQVCFNADASRIVSSSFDYEARIWDVSTGECLLFLNFNYYCYGFYSCCFSEDGSKVITSSGDGTVTVWDSYTGEELKTLRSLTGKVTSLSYRPSAVGSYI